MLLANLDKVSLAFGSNPLFDNVSLQINSGERVCIVGRNGTGKSSLLKVLANQLVTDSGEVWRDNAIRTAYLEQDVPARNDDDVFSIIASGLAEAGELLNEYHQLSRRMSESDDPRLIDRMGEVQQAMEHSGAWSLEQKVEQIASRLQLDINSNFAELSGGLRRRVLLAKALVCDPDLLLLDEPTNHLDMDNIQWLEEFLLQFNGAIVFVTHDRFFLQRLATRIVELDRGTLSSYPGNYQSYLAAKQHALDVEQVHNKKFDKKLAEEEVWIRQGIKARRTRNEGRVRALKALREEFASRRQLQGNMKVNVELGKTSGKLVIDVDDISFSYGEHCIVRHFTTVIERGDKVGIVGPNGAGKSTLIRLLLGELRPDSGSIHLGTNLDILYYDQQREQLDPEKSVIDNLGLGSSNVTVNGKSRHVVGYLKDFLFSPDRLHSPVSALSGGEKNRLMLARLFTKSCNLLVLDEPTNDLDVESLELLEELVAEFPGTLIIVSHDRTFLDNVVTSTMVLDGAGNIEQVVGGYSDWESKQPLKSKRRFVQSPTSSQMQNDAEKSGSPVEQAYQSPAKSKAKKLSYKESRELADLPGILESLEKEKAELESIMADGTFYQQDKEDITRSIKRLEELEIELAQAYSRWEELEQREN